MDDESTFHLDPPPAVRRSSLPRLALIADGFTEAGRADRTVEAVRAGVPWVHLRDHAVRKEAFAKAARELAGRLCRATSGVLMSINSRTGVAEALGMGLHTGRHGPTPGGARERLPPDALVGVSTHGRDEAEAARGAADYFFFSPVFPTASKPGHPGAGLKALRDFCRAFPALPVLALGGVTPERTAACLDAGAHGVAVLSGILHADAPTDATRAYLKALPSE